MGRPVARRAAALLGDGGGDLWPQTLFGVVVCGALLVVAPAVFWWSLPLTAGYLLAIPFAVLTADPGLGGRCSGSAYAASPRTSTRRRR